VKSPPVLEKTYRTIDEPVDEFDRLKIENRRLREGDEITELTQQCQQLKLDNRRLQDKLSKSKLKIKSWMRDWRSERTISGQLRSEVKGWRAESEKVSKESVKSRKLLLDCTQD